MKGITHSYIGALTYLNYSFISQNPLNPIDFSYCIAFSILPDVDLTSSKIYNVISKIPDFLLKIIFSFFYVIIVATFRYNVIIKNFHFSYPTVIFIFLALTALFFKLNSYRPAILKVMINILSFLIISLLYTINILHIIPIIAYLNLIIWTKHRTLSHSLLSIIIIFLIINLNSLFFNNFEAFNIILSLCYASHIILGDIYTKKGVALFYPFSKKYISLPINKLVLHKEYLDIIFSLVYTIITFFIYNSFY